MSKVAKNEELISKITESLTTEGGVISSTGSVYNDNLPEGLTPETVEAVSDYTTSFVASGMEAVGHAAIKAMVADKAINQVTADIGMGAFGSVAYSVDRSKEYSPKGEVVVVKGMPKADVIFEAGKNSGQLAAAKRLIKEIAKDAL